MNVLKENFSGKNKGKGELFINNIFSEYRRINWVDEGDVRLRISLAYSSCAGPEKCVHDDQTYTAPSTLSDDSNSAVDGSSMHDIMTQCPSKKGAIIFKVNSAEFCCTPRRVNSQTRTERHNATRCLPILPYLAEGHDDSMRARVVRAWEKKA